MLASKNSAIAGTILILASFLNVPTIGRAQFYAHGSSGGFHSGFAGGSSSALPFYEPHPYYQPLPYWRYPTAPLSSGSYGYSSGYAGAVAPTLPYYVPNLALPPATGGSAASTAQPDPTAHILLKVPPDAAVSFEGKNTKQTGAVRSFQSPPLDSGARYVYTVRVRWSDRGRTVNQKRDLTVRAGDWKVLDFTTAKALPIK